MRTARWLLLGSLLFLAVPIAAQTQIVHVNRRAAINIGFVDLNTATKEELMTLPSVGEAEASMIIGGRPYDSKRRLVDAKIVSPDVFERIEKRVTIIAPPPR
jgi:DNA uptake protein ComE-like DNA-binding protein